ncbi:hypothetical protein GW17_00008831 [Ensete ventricosum]|nr:hypothetical protein GW17_00008831 [Ensete ventricosum]
MAYKRCEEEEGRPATASHHARPTTRDSWLQLRPPARGRPAMARASPKGRPAAPARGGRRQRPVGDHP